MNMSGPGWLADIFAAVVLIVAGYSAGRLLASRAWARPAHFDLDVVHLLMGLAMAGMFVAALNPVPPGLWEVVFSGVAAWSLWRCGAYVTRRGERRALDDHVHPVSHYPTHVVMAFAMLYMYLALPAKGARLGAMAVSGATGTTADFVGLPLLFLLVLLGSGVWELDRAERFRRVPVVRDQPLTAPELALAPATTAAVGKPGLAGEPEAAGPISGSGGATDGHDDEPHDDGWLAPALMAAAHIGMCIAMGYMLVVML